MNKEDDNKVTVAKNLPDAMTSSDIVAEGKDRAKQLMDIVSQNRWAVMIQGKKFLQVEAWQTLGKFYGYTAKTKSTEYVEYGPINGFNATVEILDLNGQVVGGAEASCLTDEKKWKTSPLYSLKSMAQTRATGKAFRQILSWVAVLAGYEPTPAEEMSDIIMGDVEEELATENQIHFIEDLLKQGNEPDREANLKDHYKITELKELTKTQAHDAIEILKKK